MRFKILLVAACALSGALVTYVQAQLSGSAETRLRAVDARGEFQISQKRKANQQQASRRPDQQSSELKGELVVYPNEQVAFICGPQLKSGSRLNPFPWFDATAIKQGIYHGEEAPRVAPFGPMTLDVPDNVWRNVIAGRVSVAVRGTVVTGKGTRFRRDFDLNGPAPGYSGHFRIRDASGIERIVKVRSVESDTSLTLASPWPFASVTDTVADTFYHELNFGTNVDHYNLANYYDTALVQYINYYRTGDTRFLAYARKTADAWWHSQFVGDGTVVPGHNNHLPPRSMAFAGLMLRALDGKPEYWDYLYREVRATFDAWLKGHRNEAKLEYDVRENGYAQLYAVLLARVLPNQYPLLASGTLMASNGVATDGSRKRAALLADAEDIAINFFGRLQRADGSWRWDVDAGANIEQPFMVGLYLESAVLLHQLTKNAAVKASLREQIVRACRHLYRDAFRGGEVVKDAPQYRWRGMWYFWADGKSSDSRPYERREGERLTGGDTGMIREVRELNSTVHHAFGYAYYVTGDEAFKQMGDDVFEASYGDQVDGLHCLAGSPKAKDYDMNYRASGRYLVWRLAASNTKVGTAALSSQPATERRNAPQVSSPGLVSASLSRATDLSISLRDKKQIEDLINQIENAQRAIKTEKDHFVSPEGVLKELQVALENARTALSEIESEPGAYESARLRLGWAAARLKRANDRLKLVE
jgi:hypothetical protein